ncbi:MAG: VIT1/CCC1 transporter family protein [Candidatus Baldrarchaeia archaeon]
MEKEHAYFWKDFLECRGIKVKEFKPSFTIGLYKIFRKIFGLAFTSKVMEMGEVKTIREYYEFYRKADLSEEEKEKLKQVIEDELLHEDIFHKMSSSEKIEHIRDVFLGMNDGLVEILATVAGLTGAYSGNPYIVGIIGSIVGISGMLSMAIGTYISVKNQRQVKEQKIFENKVLYELFKPKNRYRRNLRRSLKSRILHRAFLPSRNNPNSVPLFLRVKRYIRASNIRWSCNNRMDYLRLHSGVNKRFKRHKKNIGNAYNRSRRRNYNLHNRIPNIISPRNKHPIINIKFASNLRNLY